MQHALIRGLTLDELIRGGHVPDYLLDALSKSEQAINDRIEEAVDQEVELLREQLYFARTLLDELEEVVDRETQMSRFRKKFRQMLDDSSFER
jgi:hypothetical protein